MKTYIIGNSHVRSFMNSNKNIYPIFLGPGKFINLINPEQLKNNINKFFNIIKPSENDKVILYLGEETVRYLTIGQYDIYTYKHVNDVTNFEKYVNILKTFEQRMYIMSPTGCFPPLQNNLYLFNKMLKKYINKEKYIDIYNSSIDNLKYYTSEDDPVHLNNNILNVLVNNDVFKKIHMFDENITTLKLPVTQNKFKCYTIP